MFSRSRNRLPISSLRRISDPCCEGGVDLDDAAIGPDREIAARRIFVEIFEILSGGVTGAVAGSRHQTKARIAAMVSSGALRLGQWPVAFMTTSLLPAIWR